MGKKESSELKVLEMREQMSEAITSLTEVRRAVDAGVRGPQLRDMLIHFREGIKDLSKSIIVVLIVTGCTAQVCNTHPSTYDSNCDGVETEVNPMPHAIPCVFDASQGVCAGGGYMGSIREPVDGVTLDPYCGSTTYISCYTAADHSCSQEGAPVSVTIECD